MIIFLRSLSTTSIVSFSLVENQSEMSKRDGILVQVSAAARDDRQPRMRAETLTNYRCPFFILLELFHSPEGVRVDDFLADELAEVAGKGQVDLWVWLVCTGDPFVEVSDIQPGPSGHLFLRGELVNIPLATDLLEGIPQQLREGERRKPRLPGRILVIVHCRSFHFGRCYGRMSGPLCFMVMGLMLGSGVSRCRWL